VPHQRCLLDQVLVDPPGEVCLQGWEDRRQVLEGQRPQAGFLGFRREDSREVRRLGSLGGVGHLEDRVRSLFSFLFEVMLIRGCSAGFAPPPGFPGPRKSINLFY